MHKWVRTTENSYPLFLRDLSSGDIRISLGRSGFEDHVEQQLRAQYHLLVTCSTWQWFFAFSLRSGQCKAGQMSYLQEGLYKVQASLKIFL